MPRLRLLNLDAAQCSASFGSFASTPKYNKLPAMVYMEWHAAEQVSCLPSTLAVLDLSGSTSMHSLPKTISRLLQLHTLDLHGCRSLTALPEGISNLSTLRLLDLRRMQQPGRPARGNHLPRQVAGAGTGVLQESA